MWRFGTESAQMRALVGGSVVAEGGGQLPTHNKGGGSRARDPEGAAAP
jgi:hypothetical protein